MSVQLHINCVDIPSQHIPIHLLKGFGISTFNTSLANSKETLERVDFNNIISKSAHCIGYVVFTMKMCLVVSDLGQYGIKCSVQFNTHYTDILLININ